ncbi:hypothetical protein ACFU44_00400 [Nocardia rhizosphaerihabitans]|uniref:hypothetical protein n=1 Tax=Nocardia rhizosphaerihabitans TaxID=1691570 RepID=UPI00366A9FF7
MFTLPVHPVTGVRALGIGKRGPIWPVIGGSGDQVPPVETGANPPAGTDFVAITSQETLDHIINTRLAREKAKYADYDALKTKADAFDAAEVEKLSEIQKAEKAAQDALERATKAESENLRLLVAGEKGVPASLISGTTKEELEKSADDLISWRGVQEEAPKSVTRNPQQGQPPSGKVSARALGEAEAAKRFGGK